MNRDRNNIREPRRHRPGREMVYVEGASFEIVVNPPDQWRQFWFRVAVDGEVSPWLKLSSFSLALPPGVNQSETRNGFSYFPEIGASLLPSSLAWSLAKQVALVDQYSDFGATVSLRTLDSVAVLERSGDRVLPRSFGRFDVREFCSTFGGTPFHLPTFHRSVISNSLLTGSTTRARGSLLVPRGRLTGGWWLLPSPEGVCLIQYGMTAIEVAELLDACFPSRWATVNGGPVGQNDLLIQMRPKQNTPEPTLPGSLHGDTYRLFVVGDASGGLAVENYT